MFLNETQLQEFQDIFEYLDEDGSGEVSYKELRNAFEDMEIELDEQQFQRMVRNSDKYTQSHEWLLFDLAHRRFASIIVHFTCSHLVVEPL